MCLVITVSLHNIQQFISNLLGQYTTEHIGMGERAGKELDAYWVPQNPVFVAV